MTENTEQNGKTRRTNKPKKKFSILRILILVIVLTSFIGAGVVGGWIFSIVKSAKPIDGSQLYTLLDENSFIYDSHEKLIEKVEGDGLRTIVKFDKIPKNLSNAFLAIEDQDFYNHHGVNPKRIIKALWEDLKAGAPVQGASTITQQLVKNLYLTNEKSIERKVKEAYYAFQLEKQLTKQEILEAYLNTVYLGGGAKGVQGAAFTYFSKDVSELDLAECALLAGITKNPSRYSPIKTLKKENVDPTQHYIIDDSDEIYTMVYDERYKERQQLVLKIMKNENMITQSEYDQAIQEDLKDHLKPGKKAIHGISSFITDKVKSDVIDALMNELGKTEEEAKNMLYNQGLRIYSTIDLDIQKILEKEYENNKNFPGLKPVKDGSGNVLAKGNRSILLYKHSNIIDSNQSFVIPQSDYQYDNNGNLVLLKGKRLNFTPLYDKNRNIEAIRVSLKDSYKTNAQNEMLILKGGNLSIPSEYKRYDAHKNVIIDRTFLEDHPDFFVKSNNNLIISKDNYYISNQGVVQPQSAMVITDPHTGAIKGLVGGREVKGRRLYNRALQPRQPGSAIKPLSVYTPAIDNGWTAASIIDDVPHYDPTGKLWPKNWYSGYKGLSTVRRGLELSMNIMAVKVLEQVGVDTGLDYLKKFGVTSIAEGGSRNDRNLAAMALGGMSKGISPLEMTAAYGALANDGIYIKPKSFVKVTDREGNIVLENKTTKNFVVSPQVAFIMTDMLKSVVNNGTAHRAKLQRSKIPVAGKTGTTSDDYDAWFVGYTPYYVGSIWIGNDLQIELASSSQKKLTIWNNVMEQIHQGLPVKSFNKPKDIISLAVDTVSGKLPTKLSQQAGTVRSEYFIKGTQPKEYDDVHVAAEVDTSTNQLATPYCPKELVETKVFTKRKIPYDPTQNNGIVPADYGKELPTQFCTVHQDFNQLPIVDMDFNSPQEPIIQDSIMGNDEKPKKDREKEKNKHEDRDKARPDNKRPPTPHRKDPPIHIDETTSPTEESSAIFSD